MVAVARARSRHQSCGLRRYQAIPPAKTPTHEPQRLCFRHPMFRRVHGAGNLVLLRPPGHVSLVGIESQPIIQIRIGLSIASPPSHASANSTNSTSAARYKPRVSVLMFASSNGDQNIAGGPGRSASPKRFPRFQSCCARASNAPSHGPGTAYPRDGLSAMFFLVETQRITNEVRNARVTAAKRRHCLANAGREDLPLRNAHAATAESVVRRLDSLGAHICREPPTALRSRPQPPPSC